MDIEKVLKENQLEVVVDEDEIQAVVNHSVDTFIKREREQILSYHEFICEQFRLIKKGGGFFSLLFFGWRGIYWQREEEHFIFGGKWESLAHCLLFL